MKKRHLIALLVPFALAACAAPGTGGTGPSTSLAPGPLKSANLVGVAPSAISSRLGAPDFRRTEPQAEIWQYAGGECSLFVYFYKTAGGALGARYVDARKLEGGAADRDACLASVIAKRNAPIS
ncbi:conserved hypothetical protein [Parvibaculum lavamentivorans DS-1]|uniref:Lipoprotein n=1 Tax=Parvibaculum lavamentivorans (strain DS-1 / DSM 13023 / NCIMB 13966) TaxID=402881 RepID=A7HZ32_PARL1|nr:hypothetical protein [Parvibaculum lavamentivorans]ABS65165.1 conserved hypothetical protein [Parvibaculum lavamentivorans DS-1]